jgi:mono-ADP-ribosyltransferase sirtuin 6
MADTEHVPKRGLREDEDKNEYFDNSGTVKENVKKVADAISENRGRVVVFTGAGISTSSGIPDYRGPNGVWTLRERGEEPKFDVTLESARPTDGHRVVASLVEEGFVNGLVTTNIDNLHQRGGVPKELVAELHGNCFKEVCGACAKVYWREFDVMTKGSQDHKTHRTCDACNGDLLDTIVHFNESLSQDDFSKAENWAKSAAVALVVGTSLRVKPANTLPTLAEKVFIINLQKTPLDNTSIVTYEKCVFFVFFF